MNKINICISVMTGFSLETFQGDNGQTIGTQMEPWANSLLYEQTGLSPYIYNETMQCSRRSAKFNSTISGGITVGMYFDEPIQKLNGILGLLLFMTFLSSHYIFYEFSAMALHLQGLKLNF